MREETLENFRILFYFFVTGVFIWFGLVTSEYIIVLRECEVATLETFDPQKVCPLLCKSGSNTLAGTPQHGQKNIVLETPDPEILDIMDCIENSEYNLSEWIRCNKIVTRPPA